jgi:hypothetical protein
MNSGENPIIRDESELEGALLPVAVRIDEALHTVNPAIVPLAHFQYETAIADERERQQRVAEDVAFAIPCRDKTAVSDDSWSRIKLAERRGKIESEQENEAISHGNRTTYSKNYFTKCAVENANQRAKVRDADGLQVKERPRVSSPPPASDMQGGRSAQPIPNVSGYEVKEYSMEKEYKTKEYQIKEYRSVYD